MGFFCMGDGSICAGEIFSGIVCCVCAFGILFAALTKICFVGSIYGFLGGLFEILFI